MVATVGRYKEVSRSLIPGELPPEGHQAPGRSRTRPDIGLTAASEQERAHQQALRVEDQRRQAKSRTAGVSPAVMHGVVDDPNPSLRGRRQKAAINIKTDALEFEYARDRLTEAAYRAACTYRMVLERSRSPISGGGAWSPGDRVDQVISHEIAILGRIVRAQDAVEMLRDTASVVGMTGQRILELVLIEGLTLGGAAQRLDGSSDRMAVIFWSETFRRSCQLLADHWCGPRRRAPR